MDYFQVGALVVVASLCLSAFVYSCICLVSLQQANDRSLARIKLNLQHLEQRAAAQTASGSESAPSSPSEAAADASTRLST